MEEGDTLNLQPQTMFRVESGLLRVVLHSGERNLVVSILGPGDCMVAPVFYNWDDGMARVEAQETAEILLIPGETVLEVAAESPEFSRAMLQWLSYTTYLLMERLHALAFSNLRERVARVLLNLAGAMGVPKNGGIDLGLRLTQEELAELVGTRRESLSATLQEMRNEGLIDLRYARINIANLKALQELANGHSLPFLRALEPDLAQAGTN